MTVQTPFVCPDCGAPLTVDTRAETDTTIVRQRPGTMPYVDTARRTCIVAFCSGCEFAIEVRPDWMAV